MELEFMIEKETKGAIRYQEVVKEGDAKIGSFYIRKTAFEGKAAPKRLKVVINEA